VNEPQKLCVATPPVHTIKRFLKIRCQDAEKIENLFSTLSLMDALKDADISTIQALMN
jgi:hypothetical protein